MEQPAWTVSTNIPACVWPLTPETFANRMWTNVRFGRACVTTAPPARIQWAGSPVFASTAGQARTARSTLTTVQAQPVSTERPALTAWAVSTASARRARQVYSAIWKTLARRILAMRTLSVIPTQSSTDPTPAHVRQVTRASTARRTSTNVNKDRRVSTTARASTRRDRSLATARRGSLGLAARPT